MEILKDNLTDKTKKKYTKIDDDTVYKYIVRNSPLSKYKFNLYLFKKYKKTTRSNNNRILNKLIKKNLIIDENGVLKPKEAK